MAAPTESISQGLDALLFERFDDPHVLGVYADWLAERGDPRAALVRRAQVADRSSTAHPDRVPEQGKAIRWVHDAAAEEESRLYAACWTRWFGSRPPSTLALTWSNGLPIGAGLYRTHPEQLVDVELVAIPELRFLHKVSCSPGAVVSSLVGIAGAGALRSLRWGPAVAGTLAPLAGSLVPRLELLGLVLLTSPSEDDLRGLAEARLPALRELRLWCPAADCRRVLSACSPHLASAGPPRVLKVWLEGAQSVQAVLAMRCHLATLGRGLLLAGPAQVLTRSRNALRKAFPLATLNPRPRRREGPGFAFDVSPSHSSPRCAPANFRALPPWGCYGVGEEAHEAGSGVRPQQTSHGSAFALCGACASDDTRLIYFRGRDHRDDNGDKWSAETWEYECAECGQFTDDREYSEW